MVDPPRISKSSGIDPQRALINDPSRLLVGCIRVADAIEYLVSLYVCNLVRTLGVSPLILQQ